MRTNIIILIILLVSSKNVIGHSDFSQSKDFDNVTIRIKTGFQYEEIENAWIIGELSRKLCKKLNYNQPVFIDFVHYYVGDCKPDYFIAFDRGEFLKDRDYETVHQLYEKPTIVLREVSRRFSPSAILQLLEYSINNIDYIKISQSKIKYDQNYCDWELNTIDTLEIKEILAQKITPSIESVISEKTYRDKPRENNSSFKYYFKDNKYHIICSEENHNADILLSVENIYQINILTYEMCVVFDSDSSFYFIKGINRPYTSQRQYISQTKNFFRPFLVTHIGSRYIAITLWNREERNILYKIATDKLIQDLTTKLECE